MRNKIIFYLSIVCVLLFGGVFVVEAASLQPPINIKAVQDGNTVIITWKVPKLKDYDGFRIYRSEKKNRRGNELTFVKKGVTKYVDAGIFPNKTYYYTIRTFKKKNKESTNWKQVSVKIKKFNVNIPTSAHVEQFSTSPQQETTAPIQPVPSAPTMTSSIYVPEAIISNPVVKPPVKSIKLLVVIAESALPDKISISNDEVKNIIFGPTDSLKTFYADNTYGILDITGDVVGPLAVNFPEAMLVGGSFGLDLIDPYVDFRNYDRVVIIPNQAGNCKGFASGYGQDPRPTVDGLVNIGLAMTTGQCVKNFGDKTQNNGILHEFGHILGLYHTSTWLPNPNNGCPQSISLTDPSEGNSCYSEYAGGSVMGTGNSDLYNFQKNKLMSSFGAPSFKIPSLSITENGDYWVHWFKNNPELKYYDELKIPAVNGYFSVEFRKNQSPVIDQEKIMINFVPNVQLLSKVTGAYMETMLVKPPAEALKNVDDVYDDVSRNVSVKVLKMEENRALLRIKVK